MPPFTYQVCEQIRFVTKANRILPVVTYKRLHHLIKKKMYTAKIKNSDINSRFSLHSFFQTGRGSNRHILQI